MNAPKPIPAAPFEWRDGKLHYLGPIMPPDVAPPVTPMSSEEYEKLCDDVANSLVHYDFDCVTRLREMERRLPTDWDKKL